MPAQAVASQNGQSRAYIDALMEQRRQNPAAAFDAIALAVSERASVRSSLELLTEARATIHQGVDSALLERERSLPYLLTAPQSAIRNPQSATLLSKEYRARR